MEKSANDVIEEFKSIVEVIDSKFDNGYAFKNPGLVQHLLDKIQQEKDRDVHKRIHIKSN